MEADGAGVGSVDAAEAVQEGGFAGAGGSDEGKAFAGAQGEAHPAQHRAPVIGLLDVPGLDDGSGGCGRWMRVFQGVGTVRRRRSGANGELLSLKAAVGLSTDSTDFTYGLERGASTRRRFNFTRRVKPQPLSTGLQSVESAICGSNRLF